MSMSEIVSPNNFILRITREEWFRQVFTIKKYYPGIGRRWEPGGTILLVRKPGKEDSFIGYGVLEKFVRRDDLSGKEKSECETMGWKGVLVFSDLFKFEPPLPIKETILNGSNARGRCFQGYPLTQKQVESIINAAKEKCFFHKID